MMSQLRNGTGTGGASKNINESQMDYEEGRNNPS